MIGRVKIQELVQQKITSLNYQKLSSAILNKKQ